MEALRDMTALGWLEARAPRGGGTGFDATGWPASVWILHAMYENARMPDNLSHDEVDRILRAAQPPELHHDSTPKQKIDEILDSSTVIGTSMGWTRHPGTEWQRLGWRDLGERLGKDPFDSPFPPCFRSFPYRSWPINLRPPAEGSLDREQYLRLLDHLAVQDAAGTAAPVTAYYSPVALFGSEAPALLQGTVSDLALLTEDGDVPGSPNNIWPADKSWLVFTDADLWATKISGTAQLIESLTSDPDLETAKLAI